MSRLDGGRLAPAMTVAMMLVLRAAARPTGRRDHGFGLVEVLISMLVLLAAMAAIALLLTRQVQTTRTSENRETAASIASSLLEQARGQAVTSLSDFEGILGMTGTVTRNGTTFTYLQVVEPRTGTGGSMCGTAATQTIAYKLVSISVTWDGMGATDPVRTDTLVAAPQIATSDPTKGTLAIRVNDAGRSDRSPRPVEGVQVTASLGTFSQTQFTGTEGCAVFTGLTPGTYRVTMSKSGYVNKGGVSTPVDTAVGVMGGQVTQGASPYSYDRAASLVLGLPIQWPPGVSRAVYLPGSTPSVNLSTSWFTTDLPSFPAVGWPASDATVGNLYPFVEGWRPWVGTTGCRSANFLGTVFRSLTTEAGGATSGVVPMGFVDIQVTRPVVPLTTPIAYAPAVGIAVMGTSCATGGTAVQVAVTDSAGMARLAVPFGQWTFQSSVLETRLSPAVTFTAEQAVAVTGPTGTDRPWSDSPIVNAALQLG